MKQKKLITVLAIVFAVCLLAVGGIIACSNSGKPSDDPSNPVKDTYTVTLNRKVMKLVQYDESVLTAALVKNGDAVTDSVVWSTSNPAVATVSNGTVTAVAEGEAVITATWGEAVARCDVSVSKYYDPQWLISLSDTSLALFKTDSEAESYTLTAVATYGEEVKQDGYTLTWESKNESIATVTQSGKVIAVGKGNTEIVITAIYKTFTARAVCAVKVEIPKISLLDETAYVCEIEAVDSEAKIEWKADYGTVESITDANGAALAFEQVDGYVVPTFADGVRGDVQLLIESDTHMVSANVYVADKFIYNAADMQAAVNNMADGKLYALYADIDMSGFTGKVVGGVRSLFTFKGEFDGRGHKLYNIESLDTTNWTEIFSFAANSHVHDLQIDAKVSFPSKDERHSVFGSVDSGATLEDCSFNLNLVSRPTWQFGLFSSISGTFRNSIVRFTGENTVVCLTSSFLSGEVSNIVYIGLLAHEFNSMNKIFFGGSNGSNYTSLVGKISNLYLFVTEEDYQNNNGLCFALNGKITYNGKEYSLSDWWSNNVDIDGNGSVDNTWGVTCTQPIPDEEA